MQAADGKRESVGFRFPWTRARGSSIGSSDTSLPRTFWGQKKQVIGSLFVQNPLFGLGLAICFCYCSISSLLSRCFCCNVPQAGCNLTG
ncbi:hypothetical protein M407DRAFT_181410 [Tulasnella calospora MUT 4182]|uniref:Uncharacterized protein n=1 Tax=Tulasnella calospora MUT 4182 TaxID=1051891 RepID=A0A0C3PQL5_9AGAM|nr:hypothetical protein M407DRAFT_181410 [Tulasnella calospora MUT 4182]